MSFLYSYFMVEAKFITPSHVVFNVYRKNI